MNPEPFRNGLLHQFDSETIGRLKLRHVDLPANREIEYPGSPIDHLFFIEEGIASTATTFRDGFQVEVALAGAEAVLGASVLMGTKLSLNRVYMQVAGHGYEMSTKTATDEFKRGGIFQDLTLRYLQAQYIQAAQSAGCNARHSVEQKLARHLLLCRDRSASSVLPLSQQLVANLLGASRSTVTTAAIRLQDLGLIRYARGNIHLLDSEGLEKLACECYLAVKSKLTNLPEGPKR